MNLQDMVTKSLRGYDAQRARSVQVEVGPSSLGGCARRVWHDLKQSPKINQTENLSAILGTFIHSGLEKAIARQDPFGDNYLIELDLEHGGIKGHCDLFIKDIGMVVDYKTTTLKNLAKLGSTQQRWQIHTYGWLISESLGHQVNTVALVGIPRDGRMDDIRVFQEPYDKDIALEALAWLENIKDIVRTNQAAPAPSKPVFFCRDYCPYYDPNGVEGCPSMTK